jgi:hypothetical protein
MGPTASTNPGDIRGQRPAAPGRGRTPRARRHRPSPAARRRRRSTGSARPACAGRRWWPTTTTRSKVPATGTSAKSPTVTARADPPGLDRTATIASERRCPGPRRRAERAGEPPARPDPAFQRRTRAGEGGKKVDGRLGRLAPKPLVVQQARLCRPRSLVPSWTCSLPQPRIDARQQRTKILRFSAPARPQPSDLCVSGHLSGSGWPASRRALRSAHQEQPTRRGCRLGGCGRVPGQGSGPPCERWRSGD